MATYGGQSSRNRPALYKPTDFCSQQKRVISTPASNSEVKKEEEKITFKIQQRPATTTTTLSTSEEKSLIMENNKSVKVLKESPTSEKKGSNLKIVDQKPEGGVAPKDIDKIAKLKEFMSKQQIGDKEASASGRDGGPGMGKPNAKQQFPGTTKTFTTAKTVASPGKIGSGDGNPLGKFGMMSAPSSKPFKENKDPEVTREEKHGKGKGQRDVKDGKNKGSGRASTNRNQKNVNKSPATGRKRPNQNEKPAGRTNKANEAIQHNKQSTKSASLNNGGARPKIVGKDPIINPRLPNEPHKNNSRPYDRSQKQIQMPANSSYYSQGEKIPALLNNNNEPPPWLSLQYSMNGMNLKNQSILGQPQGSDQTKLAVVNGTSSGQKKVVTVAASKDKYEQKRSVDFCKSFFENDPEVQYHRNIKKDPKSAVSSSVAPVSKEEQSVKRSHVSNSHMNSHGDSHVSSHVINHANSHNNQINAQSFLQSNTHIPSSQNPGTHIPGSMANTYSSVYQSNMAHNNLHPNPQSEHFQGSSTSSAVHMGATQAQLHAAISSHPSSLNHGHAYDLYSQVNQMNPLLTASNYPGAMSNYPPTMSQNITNVNHGFPSYSGYFPDGSHLSHGHHIQQQLDPNVVTDLLQKTKNWQEKALTKCGPIDSSQARSLIEQLIDDTYECMVCCETIKWINQVWSCSNCYHVFHLSCIRKWARSETAAVKDESGWRCPGCQNVSTRPPNKYYCFCGKVRDPDWNPRDGITPHSCGEVCCKKRTNPPCEHNCNELCHPGPCPTCPVMVAKHCPCGKTITKARCGQANSFKCENICSKFLSCGVHRCQMKCHQGECSHCEIKHSEECFCGREKHYIVCGTNEIIPNEVPGPEEKCQKKYTCNQPCNKKLACQNHDCEALCHSEECKSCALLPENITFCPCGKHRVSTLLADGEARTSCLDAIPTCESFCGKKLSCGPKGLSHLCMMKCHTGKCQPCQKVTTVQCRCGATKKEISCIELNPGEAILCERKCNKKRKCGRHKCNQKCCTDRDHACNIICGKKLSCGMHKCEEVCHTGFCPPCWRAGFDELSCNCGTTVLYPPIACGLKPPECDQPCARRHPCGHPPTHTCHSDEVCPPCTLLINKQCMGGHEIWKNVPCHLSDVSCGRNCGKILQCGFHKCIKTCHKGNCFGEGEVCVQPCPVKRKECSHPCAARCHAGVMECPVTPCKAQIIIRCRCGRKSANAFCLSGSVTSAYESFNSEILTSQLRNLQSGQSIDLASLTNADKKPKFLDCDEECSRLERNRKLAEALGIENPEGGHFQVTNYSSFLKQEAKVQFAFVQKLEEILENLVANVKKSTQSQIQHSLPPMNSTQRKIVHELADVYGCKTYSLDPEPKRNTVVVATKESYIPSIKLSTLAEREIMSPVPPQPMMLCKDGQFMVLGPQIKPILKKTVTQPKVDYFDDNYK